MIMYYLISCYLVSSVLCMLKKHYIRTSSLHNRLLLDYQDELKNEKFWNVGMVCSQTLNSSLAKKLNVLLSIKFVKQELCSNFLLDSHGC